MNQLIEYMKLHLISLEQDSEEIAKELKNIEPLYDSFDYQRLEVEEISINGQIKAIHHILSVADDIMLKTKETV